MSIKEINEKLIKSVEKDKRKSVKQMTKNGFINADDTIMRYDPNLSSFVTCNDDTVKEEFFKQIPTTWNTISEQDLMGYIKDNLTHVALSDINDFTAYLKQEEIIINEELIEDLMKEAINDNKFFKNLKADFKGKLNIQSELTILHNNDVYTDGESRFFKLKDGEFQRYTIHDVLGLFRDTIGTSDTRLVLQYVKNKWSEYNKGLTNIKTLLALVNQKKKKETILKESQSGYDKIMQIITKY